MTQFTPSQPIDVLAIEAEARRLRAQALHDMVVSFGVWLRRITTRRPAVTVRTI